MFIAVGSSLAAAGVLIGLITLAYVKRSPSTLEGKRIHPAKSAKMKATKVTRNTGIIQNM